jgi:hypothetical protein
LLLGESQRLSDYLQSGPAFIPLRDAKLRPRGKSLGDIVVNQHAILVVREVRDGDGAGAGDGSVAQAEAGESGEANEAGAPAG